MTIPTELHRILVSEMSDAAQRMAAAQHPSDKLFYFTAVFGHINRVMNYDCEPVLVFAHQVLVFLHQQLQARLVNAAQTPSETTVVPTSMFEKLQEVAEGTVKAIEIQSDQALITVLQSAAVLSYATSGNGYYLLLQDKLHI